jgi:multidrug efflux pump subunit AcrA (membrane-fusion protein)
LQQHLATAQQVEDAQKAEADARANLDSLQAQGAGGTLTVKAPFAGSVTAVSVGVGSMVSQGNPLLELVSSQGLILLAGAVPQTASMISVGNDASITPIGANQPLQGKVLMRGEVIDPTTGLVPIELSLPGNSMLPGQQAIATVTTGQVQAYLVPHEAVLLNDEGNPYVVQVIGGVAKQVEVQVLGMQDGRDGISGALNASAPVALSGNYQLEDGMKVRTAQDAGRATQ